MRFIAPAFLLALLHIPVHAAPLPETARREVLAVLDRLGSSACQFERNGTWHDATKAKVHLLSKLDYVERRARFQSAEEFIEKAASGSSVSGKPYRVRCGQNAPVDSGPWLRERLQEVRTSGPPSAN